MGLRRFEAAKVRWDDIRGEAGKARITILGKGGKEAVLPLHYQVEAALEGWREVQSPRSEWVFPSPHKGRTHITKQVVNIRMERWTKLTGNPNITPHRLRHTLATKVYEQTGDITKARDALRHSSMATTEIYARANPAGLDAVMRGDALAKEVDPFGASDQEVAQIALAWWRQGLEIRTAMHRRGLEMIKSDGRNEIEIVRIAELDGQTPALPPSD